MLVYFEPGSSHTVQVGLALTAAPQSQPPECRKYNCASPPPALNLFPDNSLGSGILQQKGNSEGALATKRWVDPRE